MHKGQRIIQCAYYAIQISCCTVSFLEDVPEEYTVRFLNKWTHLLTPLETVTTRLPECNHFVCTSIRELPGKPPTDAHSAAGFILVNTVDSYTILEEVSLDLLSLMTTPICAF